MGTTLALSQATCRGARRGPTRLGSTRRASLRTKRNRQRAVTARAGRHHRHLRRCRPPLGLLPRPATARSRPTPAAVGRTTLHLVSDAPRLCRRGWDQVVVGAASKALLGESRGWCAMTCARWCAWPVRPALRVNTRYNTPSCTGRTGARWCADAVHGPGRQHAIRPPTAAHGAVVRALRRRRGAETERGVFSAVVCSDRGEVEDVVRCFGKVAAREQHRKPSREAKRKSRWL